jgi:hypothetical protein
MTVAEARDKARAIKTRAAAGVDPKAERSAAEAVVKAEQQAKAFTLSKLVERYIDEYADKNPKRRR